MKPSKLLVLGYGNMARAIVKGILDSVQKFERITIAGRDFTKAQEFCKSFAKHEKASILCAQDIATKEIATNGVIELESFDSVLFCIKPYGIDSFKFAGNVEIAYSVMAGIDIARIKKAISAQNYVRVMPNVGAHFGESASCVFAQNPHNQDAIRAFVESFGNCVFVDSEALIDASIATSGSSPAFLALVAQSLIDCGVYHGLSFSQAQELVRQTFKGFASLLEVDSAESIKQSVTSPNGTTARGLACLEKLGVRGAFIQAGIESINRAQELAKK